MKFRTPYNRDEYPTFIEVNDGVSMCEPDQSYTVRELFQKALAGYLADISLGQGSYSSDEEIEFDLNEDDPSILPGSDITELEDFQYEKNLQKDELKRQRKQKDEPLVSAVPAVSQDGPASDQSDPAKAPEA